MSVLLYSTSVAVSTGGLSRCHDQDPIYWIYGPVRATGCIGMNLAIFRPARIATVLCCRSANSIFSIGLPLIESSRFAMISS